MTATTYHSAEQTAPGPVARGPVNSRAWARVGVVAGVTGVASIASSMAIDAVYTADSPADVVEQLSELTPQLLTFHVTTALTSVLLLVFAAGLHRRLAAQAPVGSLLPAVAASGLGLVSVATLMGSGLNTEFIFATASDDVGNLVPEAAVVYGHWVATIPWLWLGAGVAALAVAVAALRHAAAPRWIGWVSAVLGVLTTLLGISPLQYMAGMTGPIWLLVVAVGFALGDRTRR